MASEPLPTALKMVQIVSSTAASLILASLALKTASAEYSLTSIKQSPNGYTGILTATPSSLNPYGDDLTSLTFTYSCLPTAARIQISPSDSPAFTIPPSVVSEGPAPVSCDDVTYDLSYTSSPFTFTVTHESGDVLFQSSPDLSYSLQYISLTNAAVTSPIYGLGEQSLSGGSLVPEGSTATMWARDMASAVFDTNLYSGHPFYLSLSQDGRSHGGFMRNSNGMDVTYSSPEVKFEMLGGAIDLYVLPGPSPSDVISNYHSVIGTPVMQPLWALGFHQCRYGYTKLEEAVDVVKGMDEAGIPLDVAWLDIDYMSLWLDFTYDDELFPAADVKEWVSSLHETDRKFVPIVDPGILAVDPSWEWAAGYDAYTKGIEMDVFVKDITGEPYTGQVWPGPTHFPDWFSPNATEYWTGQLKSWHNLAPFDGLWVDMNEVSNFCTGQVCKNVSPDTCPTHKVDTQTVCCLECTDVDPDNSLDYPSFAIGNDVNVNEGGSPSSLGFKTIPASAVHHGGLKEYDVHNLHGTMEAASTRSALIDIRDGKRSFVLSRSSFPGHGNHAAHWTGDNAATWEDLAASIVTVNNFAMYGVSMVGSDICGFIGDTTEELCARWIETGAFHPFSRNHNTFGAASQELYLWDSVAEASRRALGMRLKILPYLYTLMYKANTAASTVSRFLWINYPTDANTHGLDKQFMLGDSLLISPVLEEGARFVEAYFPAGKWYNIFTLEALSSQGEWMTLPAELEEVNVHVAGGSILPMKVDGGLNTVESSASPYSILVALCSPDENCVSTGDLFIDDGEQVELEKYSTVEFVAKDGSFKSTVVNDDFEDGRDVQQVVFLGADEPASVKVNGNNGQFTYEGGVLTVTLESIKINEDINIQWE